MCQRTYCNNKLILLFVLSISQLNNLHYATCNSFHQLGKNKLWGLRSDGSIKNILDISSTTNIIVNNIVTISRGGDDYDDNSSSIDNTNSIVDEIKQEEEEEDTMDNNDVEFHDKVQKALEKLGLSSTAQQEAAIEVQPEENCCANGVCSSMPDDESKEGEDDNSNSSIAMDANTITNIEDDEEETKLSEEEIINICKTLSEELSIPLNICQAVVYSTPNNSKLQEKAREILLYEKDIVSNISEDSDNVQSLYEEGICNDMYVIRRALAFCDNDINNARALLVAELEEEEQDVKESSSAPPPSPVLPTIQINSDIDPTKLPNQQQQKQANKEDSSTWIYNVTTSTIQSKVLESKKPVLLDVYAHWCGPCKQLTPILEEMCSKSNGMFHLAKLNSDEERTISQKCLNVQGLPTLIGINNGNIVFIQVGSPRTEDEMKQMFMKLMNPSNTHIEEHKDLSIKLSDVAGMAAIPFVQRESLQRNIQQYLTLYEQSQYKQLDDTISSLDVDKQIVNDISFLQQVLQKVVQYPKENKYRIIKLSHPYIKGKLYNNKNQKKKKALFQILHLSGFQQKDNNDEILQLSSEVKNIAPIKIITSTLKSYIHSKGIYIKNEERKRKDDLDKLELDLGGDDEYDTDDEEEEGTKERDDDPNLCSIRLRIQQQNSKKKPVTIEYQLDPDKTSLSSIIPMILSAINHNNDDNNDSAPLEIQFVCTSKKLSLSSTNPSHESKIKEKSLRDLGFMPSISLVANIIPPNAADGKTSSTKEENDDTTNTTTTKEEMLKARRNKQSTKRNKGSGSHTMQSVGIYSKDDNAKGELIDGGGGVWYEHDVSDDDEEDDENKDDDDGDSEKEDKDENKKSKGTKE